MSTVHEVVAHPDGRWWTFEIPALNTPSPRGDSRRIVAMGQARKAADVESVARDLAAAWLDADPADISVRVSFRLPDLVDDTIARARRLEVQGRAAVSEAAALRQSAARALTAAGVSQADTATVLGLSRQRVQQLVSA